MKTRKSKRRRAPQTKDGVPKIFICHPGSVPVNVEMRNVKTPGLVVIDESHIDSNVWPDVQNKFVKVSPLLKASKLQSFNGASIRRELLSDGAKAVVLAPRLIPDDKKVRKEELTKGKAVHELVKVWFDEQHMNKEDREAAVNLLQGFMSDEGL